MVIVVGASSFIGRHIISKCEHDGIDFAGTYLSRSLCGNRFYSFDIKRDSLSDLPIRSSRPIVILCSAIADIDRCKRNKEESYDVNVLSTKRLIDEIISLHGKVVFLSSEAVFDGRKGLYDEEDKPNPFTEYGRQKLEVERYIQKQTDDYLIFRISRAVGEKFGEPDIFNGFYNCMAEGKPIVCLRDQSFCLTSVEDIAACILTACQRDLRGTYHVANDGYVTRYQLARLYADKFFGGYDKIYEKEYDEIPFFDARHIHGGLKANKLTRAIGCTYKSIDDILERYRLTYPTHHSGHE